MQGKKLYNSIAKKGIIGIVILMLTIPFNIFSANPNKPVHPTRRRANTTVVATDTTTTALAQDVRDVKVDSLADGFFAVADTVVVLPVDTLTAGRTEIKLFSDSTLVTTPTQNYGKIFTPDPTRAVWMSALFPGLGQIYNRRYWKLPLVIGGFMGLGYGTIWNNGMLRDYSRAYTDIMDNDPSTNSYMDFFPSTTDESSLNKTWLQKTLKSRKDYFRRNRDLCIISMVGVYLLAMVDAYVDASLSNFDISPDLSMQVSPAVIPNVGSPFPAIGLQMAVNF